MDLPTASEVYLYAGFTSNDISVSDVSSTLLPASYRDVITQISRKVVLEPLVARANTTDDTQFITKHKYLCDNDMGTSFDTTVDVSDVIVVDNNIEGDLSATTLTVASIDDENGYITLSGAASSTLYISYRWADRRVISGHTDPDVRMAIIYRACMIGWDLIIGPVTEYWMEDARSVHYEMFKKRYEQQIRKMTAHGTMIVRERKTKLKSP